MSVHEIGREGETVFIVSDLIDGPPLSDRIDSGILPVDTAVSLVRYVAEGLQHAHDAGVIHRDLKPQNILVSADGSPHIADFGLARREEGEITVSLDGKILGTPAYMSPEQAGGEAHSADRRTDIYSLGVILYQLLCGKLPFRGRVRSVLNQIRQDPVPSLRAQVPSIPRDLDTICLKCLEKDPDRRYDSAADLAEDLHRFQQGLPIIARPVGFGERTLRWTRRKPVEASLIALVALLAIGLVTSIFWKPTNQDGAFDSLAVLIRPSNPSSLSFSRDLTRRLNRSLGKLQHLTVAPVGDTLTFEAQQHTAAELAKTMGQKAALVGEASFDQDSVSISLQLASRNDASLLWKKDFDGTPTQLPGFEAGSIETIVRRLGIQLSGDETRTLTKRDLRNPTAFGPYLRARKLQSEGSQSALLKARDLMKEVVNLDPAFADAYAGLAAINAELGYVWLMPKEHFDEAVTWVDKALKMDDNITEAIAVKGLLSYFFEYDWVQGRAYLEKLMATDSELTELSSCFLHAYDVFQRPDLSIEAVNLAIQRNPTSQPLLIERGCSLFYSGDFEQSRDTYLQLANIFPDNVIIHWGLGRAYGQLGETDKAIDWLKKGRLLPDGEFHGLISELVYLHAKTGQSEEAEILIKGLMDQKRSGLYVDPYVLAIAQMGFLAHSPSDANRRRSVLSALEEAIDNRSSWIPSLMVDPKFFAIRSDPRFRALLVRMNLPVVEEGNQEQRD